MYSTDSALLGVRGLYNFGPDPRDRDAGGGVIVPSPVMHELAGDEKTTVPAEPGEPVSRFSAGAEVYYGLLNKSGGMSTGIRFATLAAHTGFPYTMTVTLNPLMGNLSSSYSVRAGELLSLSSRFDFNVYSYESDVVMGMELWKLRDRDTGGGGVGGEDSKVLGAVGKREGEREESAGGDIAGCLKARIDQRGSVGLLWEGRVKELVYSCGTSIDLRGGKDLITGVGLEVQYSS